MTSTAAIKNPAPVAPGTGKRHSTKNWNEEMTLSSIAPTTDNSNDQYADFTLEQLQELTGLIAEARELVEPSNQSRPLERRTEPGSPDTAGIGGGL